ncbi:DNA-processing protein DprA [Microbacterium sp. cf332]|uniref:DNA-processing protein DprA n=1 Tax=Microbacterium sp. cf332 TaxID=1761804 RepID=UPI0015A0E340|nr:DNA-processing protein DprA [Microbacterium sp. cf332]
MPLHDSREEAAIVALLRGTADVTKMRPKDLRARLEDGELPTGVYFSRITGLIEVDPSALEAISTEIEGWRASGIRVMFSSSPDYPESLRNVYDYPLVLFGTGTRAADECTVAVVGSRNASPRAVQMASELSATLAAQGVTIASGLARGIDTAAHEAALRVGGRTVAVLGHGAGQIYPRENAPLLERIRTRGGEILTQFWPGSPPTKQTFPMRNVTMSGLSGITIIVEAAEASGTRHQAQAAVHHGHHVLLHESVASGTSWGRDMVSRCLAQEFGSADEAANLASTRLTAGPSELAFA